MAILLDASGHPGKVCAKCKQWKSTIGFAILRFRGKPWGDGYRARCKDCSNADARAKRAANPAAFRAKARIYMSERREHSNNYQRKWRANNPDKVKSALALYRARNRRSIAEKHRTARLSNLEHHRAIGRKAYHNNIEKRRAYNRYYKQTHRANYRDQVRKRRNLKYNAPGSHTDHEWELLKAHYDFTCLCCGVKEPLIRLTRDHIVPLTQGGSDWITNIQPLCHTCNSSKNNKTIDYRPGAPLAQPISPARFEDLSQRQ